MKIPLRKLNGIAFAVAAVLMPLLVGCANSPPPAANYGTRTQIIYVPVEGQPSTDDWFQRWSADRNRRSAENDTEFYRLHDQINQQEQLRRLDQINRNLENLNQSQRRPSYTPNFQLPASPQYRYVTPDNPNYVPTR